MNPLSPDLMSPEERRSELAEILSSGVLRLRLQQSSKQSSKVLESALDYRPEGRGGRFTNVERHKQ